MQIVEIVLHNNSNSVFAENPNEIKPLSKVVVSVNGIQEIGTIKAIATTYESTELVEIVAGAEAM